MKYNFDENFDRTVGNARKWSKEIVEDKFNIHTDDFIAMDLADLDFKTAPAVQKAIMDRASIPDYSYTFVPDKFYDIAIDWNKKRFNMDFNKDWIKITYGTVSTLHNIVQCFTDIGDAVMFHTPAYDPFLEAVENNGRKPIMSTLKIKDNRYEMDFLNMEKQIVDNDVKLFILCNPQNPSGRIWTREELFKLSELCLKYDILLISDEIHRELVFKEKKFTSMWNVSEKLQERMVLCLSPNKAFNLGGLKTSYVIIKNKEILNKFEEQMRKNQITSPNIFAIPAMMAAYEYGGEWLDEMVDYVESNQIMVKKFIDENLPLFKVMESESSFLTWINVGKLLKDDRDKNSFFENIRICPVKGSYFVKDGEDFIRLSIGMNKRLLSEALERIKEEYNKWICI